MPSASPKVTPPATVPLPRAIVIHQEGDHDVGRNRIEPQVVVQPGEFQVVMGIQDAQVGAGQFHGFELEPAEVLSMVPPGLAPVGILAAFRDVVKILVAGNLAAVAAFVDDDEVVRFPHGLQVYRDGHVLSGRLEVSVGQHPESVEDLAVLARAAQSVPVVRMAVSPALLAPSDLVVDDLEPVVALAVIVRLRPGHDADDVLGTEYGSHAEPAREPPLVFPAHQLFLGRPHDGRVPDRLPSARRPAPGRRNGRGNPCRHRCSARPGRPSCPGPARRPDGPGASTREISGTFVVLPDHQEARRTSARPVRIRSPMPV